MTTPNHIGGAEVPPSPETQALEQRIATLRENHPRIQQQLADARHALAVAVADEAPAPVQAQLRDEVARLVEEEHTVGQVLPLLDGRLQERRAADAARHVEQLAATADELQHAYAEAANAAYQYLRNATGPEFVELYEAYENATDAAYQARRQAVWVATHAEGKQGRFSAAAHDAIRNAQLPQPPLEGPHTWDQVTDMLRLLARFAGCPNARPTIAEIDRQRQRSEEIQRYHLRRMQSV